MKGEPWALWTSRSAAYSTRTVPLPTCTDRLHKHTVTAAISQLKEQLSTKTTLFVIVIYIFYS